MLDRCATGGDRGTCVACGTCDPRRIGGTRGIAAALAVGHGEPGRRWRSAAALAGGGSLQAAVQIEKQTPRGLAGLFRYQHKCPAFSAAQRLATPRPARRSGPARMLIVGLLAVVLGATGCSTLQSSAPPATVSDASGQHKRGWSSSMEAKRIALETAALNTGIAVFRTADNQLQVNVPSEFSFDTDSAAIKPAMRPVLDRFAEDLALPVLSHLQVLIVGHTDDRGRDAANDQLSLARARSVGKYLEGQGVAAARISVEGRGEHEPSVTNDRRYGRALNRRVEMFLREPAAQ